mmetsp:Transcript_9489/g.21726  ORF Transcript_9489/g.21726 Transcript_9489/m.21726 type:complete len:334 (-) Transcript_9489:41-1042(-)
MAGVELPGKPERALQHEYDAETDRWTKQVVTVIIDPNPFAEGSLRTAYRVQDIDKDGNRKNVVAKMAKDPSEPRETYFRDVQAQMVAKKWAAEYNKRSPPKLIDFIDCFVVELATRPGRPLMGVEEFVEGVFQKHNSNVGGQGSEERHTPNAFSHFTWEASGHQLLVCDIQGVGDLYTDPQVHTANGQGFGRGNLGMTGIKAFLLRHPCNVICEYLSLPRLHDNGGSTPGSATVGGSTVIRSGTPAQHNGEEEHARAFLPSAPPCSPVTTPRGGNVIKKDNAELAPRPAPRSATRRKSQIRDAVPEDAAAVDLDIDESDESLMEAILNDLNIA